MVKSMQHTRSRSLALAAFGTILTGMVALPAPANARVGVGFGFPFPFVVAPPAYYYPPPPVYYPRAYYAPPPAYYYGAPPVPPAGYAPPAAGYSQSSQSCMTGPAVCPMEHPVTSGSACYCTTQQGRVWGRAT
jgi:hypothetical protein